jgi:hypothetical protein
MGPVQTLSHLGSASGKQPPSPGHHTHSCVNTHPLANTQQAATPHLCVFCGSEYIVKFALDGCTICQWPQGLLLVCKDDVVQHSLQHTAQHSTT